VQPAALQRDVKGTGHLPECARRCLIILAIVVQTVTVPGDRRLHRRNATGRNSGERLNRVERAVHNTVHV
jgi:hypothetical protein